MPAEVERMFSVKETPWHREGTVLDNPPTTEEAVYLAGLNWQVKKIPVYYRDEQSIYKRSTLGFVTVRTDTMQELGMVGPQYEVIQNDVAFNILNPLIDEGLVTLETGGCLRRGEDVWLQARFVIRDQFVVDVLKDEVVPFCLISNNHTGRRGASVSITPIRTVCANTLGFAQDRLDQGLDKGIVVRHTGDAQAKLVEAAETLFEGVVERYKAVAKAYAILKKLYLTPQEHEVLVLDELAPWPQTRKSFNPEARTANLVINRAEAKRKELQRLWYFGDGHIGDLSGWEAYNGVCQCLDHNTELWPTRGGAYRTASMLNGTIAQRKSAVLDNLLDFAAERDITVTA